MIREAPRIETERLVLRGWRSEDLRPYHHILQHPEVHRYLGPEPMNLEDLWRRMCAAAGSWVMRGFGGWAVELRESGAILGTVGLFNSWRGLDPEFGEEPEVGWIFARAVHGQGIASEALGAALGWAEANLDPVSMWAIIAPANAPSIALAAKFGFATVGEDEYHGEPTLILKRPSWG